MPACEVCGKNFDTERGKNVHKTQVHGPKEKERLLLLELIHEGKSTVSEMADQLDWDESRIKDRLDELMEKEFVQRRKEDLESGRDYVYELTEEGKEEIPELVEELVEETRSFVEGVRDSFKEHLGPLMPKVSVEWPKQKKDRD